MGIGVGWFDWFFHETFSSIIKYLRRSIRIGSQVASVSSNIDAINKISGNLI